MTMGIYADYSKLERRKAQLESDLKTVNAELAELEPQVLAKLSDDDLRRVAVGSTGRTLYAAQTLYAKVDDRGLDDLTKDEAAATKAERKVQAAAALKRLGDGFAHLISEGFNLNSLSARFRELDEEHGTDEVGNPLYELPEELVGLIRIDRTYRLRSTSAGR